MSLSLDKGTAALPCLCCAALFPNKSVCGERGLQSLQHQRLALFVCLRNQVHGTCVGSLTTEIAELYEEIFQDSKALRRARQGSQVVRLRLLVAEGGEETVVQTAR